MNVKFHENFENTGKILKISCVRCNFGYYHAGTYNHRSWSNASRL